MITEPELVGESDPDPARDVLSAAEPVPPALRSALARLRMRLPLPRTPDTYHPRDPGGPGDARSGPPGGRPWRPRSEGRGTRVVWTLVGLVTASAVWVAVLALTGFGDRDRPDLHGYRVTGNPCTIARLEPLTTSVGDGFYPSTPVITKGPGLDHVSCSMITGSMDSAGWDTFDTLTLTVDLHKRSGVGGEFADLTHVLVPAPTPVDSADFGFMSDSREVTRPLDGIGDEAYTVYGTTRQALTVRHGGAVFSLSIDGVKQWDGAGRGPVNTDGSPIRTAPADTTALRRTLVPTMRTLMASLRH
ncbi:hypothetical protein ABZ901_22100 [Actinacidiphila alni]|uniref:hypothetical protein n=1 Tax=Actinacidiphila alni TaxID=380248 RepID=UPI003410D764